MMGPASCWRRTCAGHITVNVLFLVALSTIGLIIDSPPQHKAVNSFVHATNVSPNPMSKGEALTDTLGMEN